jgi:tetratricopeptide (TPR) repeat protein
VTSPAPWAIAIWLLTACATGPRVENLTQREQATVLLQRGDGKAATVILEQLAREAPADLSIARALAEAHVKGGSADLFLARLAGNSSAISHYQQGLILFSRSADATGPAVEQFRKASAISPTEAEFHYRLGVALLESERFEDSLPELKQAISLSPSNLAWQLPLAKALHHTGDDKNAVEAVRMAITAAPSPTEVRAARALMGQINDPLARFPKQAQARLEKGIAWLDQGDVPQQAIISFEEILRDFPDLGVVHSLLGMAYQRLDDAGRAVDEFKRALELNPEDARSHYLLGELYFARQRQQQAKEHFERALEKNPTLDEAWLRLGDLALDRQDLVTARGCFRTLTFLAPDASPARGKLALVYQLEGDWPGADRELRRVVDKEPENMEFVLRLGMLHAERYLKARQPAEKKAASEEAAKWLTKVLEAQPENALASRALETIKAR